MRFTAARASGVNEAKRNQNYKGIMPIKNEVQNLNRAESKEALLASIAELWDAQEDRVIGLLGASEDSSVTLNFQGIIDASDSEPSVEVRIGFGQRYKDKRQRMLGNPNQPALFDRENQPAVNGENGAQMEVDGNGTVVTFDHVVQGRKSGRKQKEAAAETEVTEAAE